VLNVCANNDKFWSLQRFYMVKPCPKEMKCDVELSSYAIRDAEEYKNFCDRQKDQRPQPEEVIAVCHV